LGPAYRDPVPSPLKRVLRQAAPWLLLTGGIFWVTAGGGRQPGAFELGARLPELAVDLSDGSRFELSEARKHVTVLNFWASYCAPCRAEAPILSALQAPDVRVVGLSIEGLPAQQMLRAAADFGMHYPIAAVDAPLLDRMRVRAVPTTYVIARDGTIVLSRVGGVTRDELEAAIADARRRG
jgi:cytochrome c biogenesis protein CcmG/thiol:disulfide interchange protein DsbE